jgi:hypothetical protein
VVAKRVMSWAMTSAFVERALSMAGSITTKHRMRTTGHSVRAQLMVQINWNIALAFLLEVLARGQENGVRRVRADRTHGEWSTAWWDFELRGSINIKTKQKLTE